MVRRSVFREYINKPYSDFRNAKTQGKDTRINTLCYNTKVQNLCGPLWIQTIERLQALSR